MSRPTPRQAVPYRSSTYRRPDGSLRPGRPRRRRRTLAIAFPIVAILSAAVVGGLGAFAPSAPSGTERPAGAAPANTGTAPAGSELPAPSDAVGDGTAVVSGAGGSVLPEPEANSVADPEELTGYRWPLRDGLLTSFFEKRRDGLLVIEGQRVHEGIDLTTFCGDYVLAAHSGTVVGVGRRGFDFLAFSTPLDAFWERMERGRMANLPVMVLIDDGNGYRSVYSHLWRANVKKGDVVEAGQMIGWEGSSGYATGCHLHYELIRLDGPWMTVAPPLVRRSLFPPYVRERIDPMRVLSVYQNGAPRYLWGARPPQESPGLGRRTAPLPRELPPPEEDSPAATDPADAPEPPAP